MQAPTSKLPLRIFDWSTDCITSIKNFAEDEEDHLWLDLLFSRPSKTFIKNVTTRWGLLRSHDLAMPLTMNIADYGNSYVCSPYNGCISYPLTEIRGVPSQSLRFLLKFLIYAMAPWFRIAKINRVVMVNNWLLSTNLYRGFDLAIASEITQRLVERFPMHAIAFRSLNHVSNAALIQKLESLGYLLLPSRQVYFFDGLKGDFAKRPNVRWDSALLRRTDYQIVPHDGLFESDAPRMEELYRMLYIDKYSVHNPQFTAEFLNQCRERRLLRMWGLRTQEGRLDGIVGVFDREQVVTAPLVGYDTSLPKKTGLYRLLMAIVMKEALDRKLVLNLSSGAAEFKRLRGGNACLEYTAVYCRHLNRVSKMTWQLLTFLLKNVGAPILRKYQL